LTVRTLLVALAALGAAGCATKGAVRRVETEVAIFRAQQARADSARAAELGRIIALQQRILDSLHASREAVRQFRGETTQELLSIQQQLVTVQELAGQSTRRLSELRRDLDNRSEQLAAQDTTPPVTPADSAARAAPPVPTPDQLYQSARAEALRGSWGTARAALQEFVRIYPTHGQMPDVVYALAETFEIERPDSAAHYYGQVAERYAASARAPAALYKLGLMAERRQDRAAARAHYQRLIQQYPRSSEADLARPRLAQLQP
jgi:TolA-binding protein